MSMATGIDLLLLNKLLKTGQLVLLPVIIITQVQNFTWVPGTFADDHESFVSLSDKKEDATFDELIAVVSAEDP